MLYTPTSPTLLLCQNLAAFVNGAWNPSAPDGVDWDFWRAYGDADGVGVPKISGRQVLFMPAEYDWANGTRGNEEYTHRVTCLIGERYADGKGEAPRDWIAERVDFVHTQIVKGLRFTRNGPAPFDTYLMSLAASVEVVDTEKLIGSGKLFWCLVQLEFLELVP